MFTPNKLNYGTCPHCKIVLNQMNWIPMSALGSANFQNTECPVCFKGLEVKVHVTFDVQVEIAEKFDFTCMKHEWHHYQGDQFESCKKCEAIQEAGRER